MAGSLGIIGAGNMAEAIVRGLLAAQVLRPEQIVAADVSPQRRELFQSQLKVQAVGDNAAAARDVDIVLLSVKPQVMAEALAGLGQAMSERTLIVSIAAGISSAFIEKHLGGTAAWRVIRSMPNTPMLAGEGMVALARGQHANDDDIAAARRLFQSSATVIELPEDKIDAVTALSGSGPAYFFYLVEHMIQAAQQLGLSATDAHLLATQTAAGAARMLVESSESPQELRRKVTSPGGTTHAAISHMEQAGVGRALVDAILAAQRRSRELGV